MPWDAIPRQRDPACQRGMELIGRAVRRARHRHGWSQRDLAWRTGIHQSTISRIEAGLRMGIRFERFAVLVFVLGGLDFDPPGEPMPEPILSRRAQILVDEAALQAAVRAERLSYGEDL